MHFHCRCGHRVTDQTDYISYKAAIVKDEDSDYVWGALADDLGAYAAIARRNDAGARADWIREHLPSLASPPGRPDERRLTDEDVIWYYVAQLQRRYAVDAFECEQCGRLWIGRGVGARDQVSFSPDSGRYERVLATEHQGGDRPAPHPDLP